MKTISRRKTAAFIAVGGVACAGLVLGQANAAAPSEPCDANGVNVCREMVVTNKTTDIRGVQVIGLMSQGPESPDKVLSNCLPVAPNSQASGQYANLAAYVALQVYTTSDCSDAGSRRGGDTGTVPPGNVVTVPESGPLHITFDDTALS